MENEEKFYTYNEPTQKGWKKITTQIIRTGTSAETVADFLAESEPRIVKLLNAYLDFLISPITIMQLADKDPEKLARVYRIMLNMAGGNSEKNDYGSTYDIIAALANIGDKYDDEL